MAQVVPLLLLSASVMRPTLAAPAARKTATFAMLAMSLFFASNTQAAPKPKLDNELSSRAAVAASWRRTRLIVRLSGQSLPVELQTYVRGRLDLIGAYVLDMPDSALNLVAQSVDVADAHFDRPIWAADYLSTRSTGADVVWQSLGYTGAGIGVAVIDSGITAWHDDLTNGSPAIVAIRTAISASPSSSTSSTASTLPYDDNGHGIARRRHHRRQRLRLERREGGHRARRVAHRAEGARRERQGHDQQHHRGARLGGRERARPTTSASSTCRSARRSPSRTGPTR